MKSNQIKRWTTRMENAFSASLFLHFRAPYTVYNPTAM